MNENGTRRKRTAAEKLRIVMTGWDPGVNVAELCRREGIVPTQFYLERRNARMDEGGWTE